MSLTRCYTINIWNTRRNHTPIHLGNMPTVIARPHTGTSCPPPPKIKGNVGRIDLNSISYLITPCIANSCRSLTWSGVIPVCRILPLLFQTYINLSPYFLLPQYPIVIFNPLLLYLPIPHSLTVKILLSCRMRDIPIQTRRDLHTIKTYHHYLNRPIFLSLHPIFCHAYWYYIICIYHKTDSNTKATPHLEIQTERAVGYKHDTIFPVVLFFLRRLCVKPVIPVLRSQIRVRLDRPLLQISLLSAQLPNFNTNPVSESNRNRNLGTSNTF